MAEGSGCIIGFFVFMVVTMFNSIFGSNSTHVRPQ